MRAVAWLLARALFGFAVLWVIFFAIDRAFPYLTAGADVVYAAKLHQEETGTIFPPGVQRRRVMIFGNSKVLAGFIPDLFDQLASGAGRNDYSYNSGYPDRAGFVGELQAIVNHGQVPDVVLLTMPWGEDPGSGDLFHLARSDHELADTFFPFRHLVRDAFSFVLTAQEHGGVVRFYQQSAENTARMLRDRGYYFIAEQSHFPGNRLPADFHLDTDRPNEVRLRVADPRSAELAQLNRIVEQHNIACYYVPTYVREGEQATPPPVDTRFDAMLREHSRCALLGPDYLVYPNSLFSDTEHLNPAGARVYTRDIERLLAGAGQAG